MDKQNTKRCTAFLGTHNIASGDLLKVVAKVKEIIGDDDQAPVLIFDDSSSELIEIDFRGTVDLVLQRLESSTQKVDTDGNLATAGETGKRGPGRPRLGVVSREVTLMPRHWEWLNSQPGGASVALRKLVEEARRVNIRKDQVRHTQEVTYRFISAMAGNLPGFEEAARALFAGESQRFRDRIASWPANIRDHAQKLVTTAFQEEQKSVTEQITKQEE